MLAAGEGLPAGRTDSDQVLLGGAGVVLLDSFYCCSWPLAALGKRRDFREPSIFYCYNIHEEKKVVCFTITVPFTTYFCNCKGASNYVMESICIHTRL